MKTIVVSNIHRTPLITPHISHLNPVSTLTPDYPYPAIGHYRCWYGHVNALICHMDADAKSILVFEDDAIPDKGKDWNAAILAGQKMVEEDGFEIACLHGRGYDTEKFYTLNKYGFDWLVPNTEDRWVLGTLTYVMSRRAADRFIADDFHIHGTNIDIWMWSHRNHFCLIKDTPFIHGHGNEGSILERPRNTECVNR